MNRDIFRAYDIRGVFGVDFEPSDFYRIAAPLQLTFYQPPKIIAIGHDVRESSPQLWQQVVDGLTDANEKRNSVGKPNRYTLL